MVFCRDNPQMRTKGASSSRRVVVAALVVALVTTVLTTGSQADSHLSVPDGSWEGTISFAASGVLSGGTGFGGVSMESTGGTLSGTFAWEFASTQTATVLGEVRGAANAPEFKITQILPANPDVSGDAPIQMFVLSAACESVTGSGTPVRPVDAVGHWRLWRAGATADLDALTLAIEQLEDLIAEVEAGVMSGAGIDSATLFFALLEADTLGSSVSRSPECGGSAAFDHRSVAADAVERLLRLVLDNRDAVDTRSFANMVLAAVEAGIIGSGTSAAETDLEFAVIEEIEARIIAAGESGDSASLFQLGALTQQLGFESLRELVDDYLTAAA